MKTRVIIFILVISAALSVTVAGLVAGVWDLALSGRAVLAFCHSLFEVCAGYAGLAGFAVLALGVAVVASGIIYGVSLNIYRFVKASAAIKAMPRKDTGACVVLIKDDAALSAFTWGFFKPRIYISTGLVSALTNDELRAVTLHEAGHRHSHDPLRFFLLSILSDIFVYIPLARYWATTLRAQGEFAADDYAAMRTGDAVGLASALLKVASSGMTPAPVPVSFAGFGAPAERITRLLNDNPGATAPKARRYTVPSIVTSLVMASFLTFAFLGPLPVKASTGVCTTKHCTMHAHTDKLSRACKAHCAAGAGAHSHMH